MQERSRLGSAAWLIAAIAMMIATGCAKQVPQEVTDVNRALAQAKDGCASVYAAAPLSSVQSGADEMNTLADSKKFKKARNVAIPLIPQLDDLNSSTNKAKNDAKLEAEQAIAELAAAVDEAKREDAPAHAADKFEEAKGALEAARKAAQDPCKYREAKALADGAVDAANQSRNMAIVEKKRIEEERRKAEEERRRLEEEERRRRAEEERLRRFPPTYVVESGDSLWRITGMETIYENPIYWPIVHEANEDSIADPDLIYPGQQLTIPRDMSEDARMERLKVLWGRYAGATAED